MQCFILGVTNTDALGREWISFVTRHTFKTFKELLKYVQKQNVMLSSFKPEVV